MGREILSKEMEGTMRGAGLMDGSRVRNLIWSRERSELIREEGD